MSQNFFSYLRRCGGQSAIAQMIANWLNSYCWVNHLWGLCITDHYPGAVWCKKSTSSFSILLINASENPQIAIDHHDLVADWFTKKREQVQTLIKEAAKKWQVISYINLGYWLSLISLEDHMSTSARVVVSQHSICLDILIVIFIIKISKMVFGSSLANLFHIGLESIGQ